MNNLLLLSCLWSCVLFSTTMTVADAASLKGQRKVATRNLKDKSKRDKRSCKERTTTEGVLDIKCGDKKMGDRIHFNVAADQGIDVGIEYKTFVKSLDGDTKTSTKFDVKYTQLLEYRPETPEAQYDFDETSIVQTLDLSTWTEKVEEGTDNAEDGTMTYLFKTADEDISFRFTVDTTVQPETQMSANKMKIDVDIKDFPWLESGTFLALISEVRSEKKVQTKFPKRGKKGVVEGDVQQITQGYAAGKKPNKLTVMDIAFGTRTADNMTPYGAYSILPEAMITVPAPTDTVPTDDFTTAETAQTTAIVPKKIFVLASEFEGDMTSPDAGPKSTIAFSFIHSSKATEIYWDPEVGVGYNSAASSLLNAASGVVKKQWWLGLTVMMGVVGNLLL